MHVEIRTYSYILSKKNIDPESYIFKSGYEGGKPHIKALIHRLQSPTDLNGFLPPELKDSKEDAAIEAWLRAQWAIFVEQWNACFTVKAAAEGGAAAAASPAASPAANVGGPNVNTVAQYDAKTMANAAAWDAETSRIGAAAAGKAGAGGAGAPPPPRRGGSRRRRSRKSRRNRSRKNNYNS
jgi:hypothetical protein